MPKFVELKKEIREKQVLDKKIIKNIEREIEEFRQMFIDGNVINMEQFTTNFPFLYKQLLMYIFNRTLEQNEAKNIINDFHSSFKEAITHINGDPCEFLKNVLDSLKQLLKLPDVKKSKTIDLDLDEDFDKILSDIRRVYNANQLIINAMDNDKIINYIDLERLLAHLASSTLSTADTFEIFSLAVGFDIKYLQMHPNIKVANFEYVEKLSSYFNVDGTLKINDDIESFKLILLGILSNFMLSYSALAEFGILTSAINKSNVSQIYDIIDEYADLFTRNIEKAKNAISVDKTPKERIDVSINLSVIDRMYLDELKRYYRNNELVEIPEDMEAFLELLDKCEIEEAEKRYILGLINEAKKVSQDRIVKYLNPGDRKVYEKALEILSGLHHNNGDYYVLVQFLDDLKTVGDILEETQDEEDKIYLEAEVSDLIIKIEEVISKYLDKEESENTILFLLDENEVPYLKLDSDLLDGSFYKMVCNGIKKIRKDNQSNFRLVMTNDNISYKVYDILSSKLHLSFIEIDNGIYLLLGADVVSRGYDSIIRRASNHEKTIQYFETLVKDGNTRNAILSHHEQYFSLFNPNEREVSRKRVDHN